ncbi:hypothetical protein [Rufibacter tibetensis]|uniref:Uncharacterized protein n=1 Tax=Rufibacter tibetensis TaxID=512763 RepID=A0A0P0CAX8_9BACT|nr:hypothetical protein [Rufibacter tibetensis]ALJ00795.1 hypothetical protein DC20_19665 [Rufibacter tibetensis]
MTDKEAKVWVDKMFNLLKEATSLQAVQDILLRSEFSIKNKLNLDLYPPIQFRITDKEIKTLKDEGILNADNTFKKNLPENILNPVTKLLYAIAWKNGDLKKVKHIVDGILECKEDDKSNREAGVVFYQFGKHLSKTLVDTL